MIGCMTLTNLKRLHNLLLVYQQQLRDKDQQTLAASMLNVILRSIKDDIEDLEVSAV